MLTLLWVALAMAAKDSAGVLMTVAEVRGRGHLAGLLDAAAIKYGWNAHAIETLAVMCVTSYIGTRFWTRLSQRIKANA